MTEDEGVAGPATEDYMDVRAEMENPANWTRDERTCGCVFWAFQHPLADEGTDVKPWEAVKHG